VRWRVPRPWVSSFTRSAAISQSRLPFSEIPPAASGINFVHTSGRSAQKYCPNPRAPVRFLDLRQHGWDGHFIWSTAALRLLNPAKPLRNALYRMTARYGCYGIKLASCGGYGMGVAAVTIMGDGFPDLYVTRRRTILYRNKWDGTFTDLPKKSRRRCSRCLQRVGLITTTDLLFRRSSISAS